MTFFDFWQCAKHYYYITIGLPIIFALIALFATSNALSSNTNLYTAIVDIYSNTGGSLLYGLTEAEADNVMRRDPSIVIEVDNDSQAAKISLAVSTSQEQKSVEVANEIAESAVAKTKALFSEDERNVYENYTGLPFETAVSDVLLPEHHNALDRGSILKIGVGFAGGLVIAICIIVLIYAVRRPVIRKDEIEECFQLPVLTIIGKNNYAELLLANIRFAMKNNNIGSVCFVPVSDKSDCQKAVSVLEHAAQKESISTEVYKSSSDVAVCLESNHKDNFLAIYDGRPLSDSMKAAYASQKTDATLIVVKKWNDSMKTLKNVAEELLFADAKLVGCILVEK